MGRSARRGDVSADQLHAGDPSQDPPRLAQAERPIRQTASAPMIRAAVTATAMTNRGHTAIARPSKWPPAPSPLVVFQGGRGCLWDRQGSFVTSTYPCDVAMAPPFVTIPANTVATGVQQDAVRTHSDYRSPPHPRPHGSRPASSCASGIAALGQKRRRPPTRGGGPVATPVGSGPRDQFSDGDDAA